MNRPTRRVPGPGTLSLLITNPPPDVPPTEPPSAPPAQAEPLALDWQLTTRTPPLRGGRVVSCHRAPGLWRSQQWRGGRRSLPGPHFRPERSTNCGPPDGPPRRRSRIERSPRSQPVSAARRAELAPRHQLALRCLALRVPCSRAVASRASAMWSMTTASSAYAEPTTLMNEPSIALPN